MRFKIRIKEDRRGARRLRQLLSPKHSRSIRTGWWNSMHEDGITVAQIAAWNEEGRINKGFFNGTITPPRPFVRLGFIPATRKKLNNLAPALREVFSGRKTWDEFFTSLSSELKEDLQEVILEWSTPPNSAATIALKGFNDPLIESGLMYDSVKTEVINFTRREK